MKNTPPAERTIAMALFGFLCMFAGAMLYRQVVGAAAMPASANAALSPATAPAAEAAVYERELKSSRLASQNEPTTRPVGKGVGCVYDSQQEKLLTTDEQGQVMLDP